MYKPLADSTLQRMKKKEIIELLRIAEHNARVAQEFVSQQAENLKYLEPVVRCSQCKHQHDLDVHFDNEQDMIDKCPTVYAVPIEALEQLRDKLYKKDLITMQGVKQLNMLIRQYKIC